MSPLGNYDYVVNLAANVSFTLPMTEAYNANVRTSLNVAKLCKEMGARLVHFSTAYVGSTNEQADLNWEAIRDSVEGDQSHASSEMMRLSYPNTYSFTKAVAEHAILSLCPEACIIRPSIVGPSVAYPRPGWSPNPSTVTAGAAWWLKR